MRKRLLCTDLDRTLIPNGTMAESPRARELFARIAKRNELTLVYVTGRHRALVEEAIGDYELPKPAYFIGDVGTTIYKSECEGWSPVIDWQIQLEKRWPQSRVQELICVLQAFPALRLQEQDKQNRFKVSYYVHTGRHFEQLIGDVGQCVAQLGLNVNLIWSHDQAAGSGLLDILPESADKLAAIRYLMSRLGFDAYDTLFAGDSGNDLQVFRSEIPSIIVANADEEIKRCALLADAFPIYVATGNFHELNGNYCAGIIEGACHFWPEVHQWITDK